MEKDNNKSVNLKIVKDVKGHNWQVKQLNNQEKEKERVQSVPVSLPLARLSKDLKSQTLIKMTPFLLNLKSNDRKRKTDENDKNRTDEGPSKRIKHILPEQVSRDKTFNSISRNSVTVATQTLTDDVIVKSENMQTVDQTDTLGDQQTSTNIDERALEQDNDKNKFLGDQTRINENVIREIESHSNEFKEYMITVINIYKRTKELSNQLNMNGRIVITKITDVLRSILTIIITIIRLLSLEPEKNISKMFENNEKTSPENCNTSSENIGEQSSKQQQVSESGKNGPEQLPPQETNPNTQISQQNPHDNLVTSPPSNGQQAQQFNFQYRHPYTVQQNYPYSRQEHRNYRTNNDIQRKPRMPALRQLRQHQMTNETQQPAVQQRTEQLQQPYVSYYQHQAQQQSLAQHQQQQLYYQQQHGYQYQTRDPVQYPAHHPVQNPVQQMMYNNIYMNRENSTTQNYQ